jgi:ATP-dependent Clp protease ATP-binding subunit ClpX
MKTVTCYKCGGSIDADKEAFAAFDEAKAFCLPCTDTLATQLRTFTDEAYANKQSSKPNNNSKSKSVTDVSAKLIYEKLSNWVVGQKDAKKTIALSASNHVAGLKNNDMNLKSNVIVIGESGTGKTELMRAVSNIIGVPVVIYDCSSVTPAGYVGHPITDALRAALAQSNWNVEKAETSIIFLDEFDKMTSANEKGSEFKNKIIQYELLKMLEGGIFSIPKDKASGEAVTINTSKITFIAAGVFQGLVDVAPIRGSMGLNLRKHAHDTRGAESIAVDNLMRYGLIPELIGRFPKITYTHELTQEDLIKIMTEPSKSVVSEYQQLFKIKGSSVEFDMSFLKEVAASAIKFKLGARGIRREIDMAVEDYLFNIEDYQGKTVLIQGKKEATSSSESSSVAA